MPNFSSAFPFQSSPVPMLSPSFPRCNCCDRGGSSPVSRLSDITFPVRHRGIFRQLCTACVLKMHPGQFCPICFTVFDDDENPRPGPRDRKMCISCPTICHSLCLTPASNTPFECSVCKDRSFSFFAAGESDLNKSKQFLAAAKLAKNSIDQAVVAARQSADRKAREAIVARNEASAAMEYLEVRFGDQMKID